MSKLGLAMVDTQNQQASQPTSHPCNGHACDHCYVCDVVGVCCASISAADRARLEVDARASTNRLRATIVQDAQAVPSLRELVRQEAEAGSLPASARVGLLAAALSDRLPTTSRKEATYVVPPRPHQ
jgi:hypothetical protein